MYYNKNVKSLKIYLIYYLDIYNYLVADDMCIRVVFFFLVFSICVWLLNLTQ